MNRLVLGYAAVGTSFVKRLAERPGSLVVLVDGDDHAEPLREAGIDANRVDTGAVDDIRTVAGDIDSVVAAPAADALPRAVRTARSAYPDAFLMACFADGADREAVPEADRIVDVPGKVGQGVLECAGDDGLHTRELRAALDDIDGRLAVLAHDNPDPDAIASAVGLRHLASEFGIEAEACYYGDIGHQENRALVNLFEFDLRNLDDDADLSSFDAVALVDHSRPGVNDGLPPETPIDIVVDHHPPRTPVNAGFVDLRSDFGATCTILAEYLDYFGIELSESLASGLLYGIRTDTQDFCRGVSVVDFETAAGLVESADPDRLRQVESPSVSVDTLETVGSAISARQVTNDILASCVGEISDRDTLAQAADKLLDMEGITATLVSGYTDGTVFISARSRGVERDLGEILREAFAQIGDAGGHADMAGAQIPTDVLTEDVDPDERCDAIADVITDRFFEALGVTPDYGPFIYAGGDGNEGFAE